MMDNSINHLNESVLELLARGECSGEELSRIENHLTECSACRDTIGEMENSTDWTAEILPVLRQDVFGETCEAPESLGHSSVLQLLGPTENPDMLGRIGPYDIVGVVGRGGMGVVFKAYEASLDRYVAIKMLHPHLAESGAARQRFAREGKAAAAVIDDSVLPIFGVDTWQGIPYLVMQYVAGESLQQRIARKGPLELTEILRLAKQIAQGLSAAHAQGLVRRDVKPSNVLLAGTVDRALLTDFGLARAADDAAVTRSGVIAGTPQYMSPEQSRGESVDARSDLFSLGSLIYTMCTGHSPFRAETSYGVLHRLCNEAPRPIREVNPAIPSWLCRLVERLMDKTPSRRFESARQLESILTQAVAHVEQPDATDLPAELQVSSVSKSWTVFAGGLALVLSLVLAFFPWLAKQPDKTGQSSESGPVLPESIPVTNDDSRDSFAEPFENSWDSPVLDSLRDLHQTASSLEAQSKEPFLPPPSSK